MSLTIKEVFKRIGRLPACFRRKAAQTAHRLTLLYYRLYYGNKIILLESQKAFGGNCGELFRYLRSKREYRRYVFVWQIFHFNKADQKNQRRVLVFPRYESCRKKNWLVENAMIAFYDDVPILACRKDAKTVYLTHGSPILKNVKGLINVPPYVDHAICPSGEMIGMMSDQYSFPEEKFVVAGLPRNDVLFQKKKDVSSLFSPEDYRAVILWTPTFRKALFTDRNDSEKDQPFDVPLLQDLEDAHQLNNCLRTKGILLLIKPHPLQDVGRLGQLAGFSHIRVLMEDELTVNGLSINDLFLHTDALISDYSSIAFDYLLIDKPLAFITDDIGEYKLGLVDNYQTLMPGTVIDSLRSLLDFIGQISAGEDAFAAERVRVRNIVHTYQHGGYCERIEELFLKNVRERN